MQLLRNFVVVVCALLMRYPLSGAASEFDKKPAVCVSGPGSSVGKQESKIVYLIAPPRSLSTAFLRMMQARGDFEIMNEPSYVEPCSVVKQKILQQAERGNVFLKEMTFCVKDFLLKDRDFVARKNVYFLFLMRNPHHAIISRYKKSPMNLDAKVFSRRGGYQDLYEIFTHIKAHAKNPPSIILAEDLYTYPEATVKALCAHLRIPYKPEALQWDSLDSAFSGKEWSMQQDNKTLQVWHSDVMNSTGLHKPSEYKLDEQGNPSFEEVADKFKDVCKQAYIDNVVYYKVLLEEQGFFITA